ncbi:MAG TPA: TIGR02266 family protein, partial [Anaeromyxobacteraceae bacterium]
MNERDRRAHPRFPLVLAVEYPDSAARIRDQTENLSAGGLFIRTERQFAAGDRVTLLVSFPGVPDPVELGVEVRRVRPAEGSQPAGVAVWVPPDREEDRRTLERLTRAAAAAAEARRGGYRILLVEDNSLVAAMYTSALRRLSTSDGYTGLSVEVARDGHEAFARLLATPSIDLVVTDIYMPVMSGFTLVEKIRAEERLHALPIVVISSGASEERERLARLGVNFLLQKP